MELSAFLVRETDPMVEAMRVIDANGYGVVFLQDESGKVVATLTDGDIRRHILRSGSLSEPVRVAANYQFAYQQGGRLERALQKHRIIPVLDAQGRLESLLEGGAVVRPSKPLNAPVVIMAGGKGTRLYPYTQVLPKPLIPVTDRTITEHIIGRFLDYGCRDVTMIVNHKKEMIKAYFADVDTGAAVAFVDEDRPLGTGGGLGLLRGRLRETFFLTNCDILVDADYAAVYDFHRSQGNLATIVCAAKTVVVPYGTIEVGAQGAVAAMREKPEFSFLTNTGFYLLEPEFLERIPPDTFVHITDLLQGCMDRGERVGIYPVSEAQWSDMGQLEELEKMRRKLEETL